MTEEEVMMMLPMFIEAGMTMEQAVAAALQYGGISPEADKVDEMMARLQESYGQIVGQPRPPGNVPIQHSSTMYDDPYYESAIQNSNQFGAGDVFSTTGDNYTGYYAPNDREKNRMSLMGDGITGNLRPAARLLFGPPTWIGQQPPFDPYNMDPSQPQPPSNLQNIGMDNAQDLENELNRFTGDGPSFDATPQEGNPLGGLGPRGLDHPWNYPDRTNERNSSAYFGNGEPRESTGAKALTATAKEDDVQTLIQTLIGMGLSAEEAFAYAAQAGWIPAEDYGSTIYDATTTNDFGMTAGDQATGRSSPIVNPGDMPVLRGIGRSGFDSGLPQTNPQAATGSGWPMAVYPGAPSRVPTLLATNDFEPGDPRPPSDVPMERPGRFPYAFGLPDFGGMRPARMTSINQSVGDVAPPGLHDPYNQKGNPNYWEDLYEGNTALDTAGTGSSAQTYGTQQQIMAPPGRAPVMQKERSGDNAANDILAYLLEKAITAGRPTQGLQQAVSNQAKPTAPPGRRPAATQVRTAALKSNPTPQRTMKPNPPPTRARTVVAPKPAPKPVYRPPVVIAKPAYRPPVVSKPAPTIVSNLAKAMR
jgi:hypothetical protein